MNDAYQNVSTDSVYESRTNPRRHFDETKLAELVDSVKQVGILEPLLVRKNPDGKGLLVGCEYELIAGARRYRAGKKAGLKELPVRICEMTDQQVLEVQLIENLLREDVDEVDEGPLWFRRYAWGIRRFPRLAVRQNRAMLVWHEWRSPPPLTYRSGIYGGFR